MFLPPDARINKLHIDIVGPFPHSEGYRYLLTCIDRFTRWLEAIQLPYITAPAVAAGFFSTCAYRFGCPTEVITGCGRHVDSLPFTELTLLLGMTRFHFKAYHPQRNDDVERRYRHLNTSLATQNNPSQWVGNLPLTHLGMRTAIKSDLGCCCEELVYDTNLRLPFDFFFRQVHLQRPEKRTMLNLSDGF